jgi:hypothetical protein
MFTWEKLLRFDVLLNNCFIKISEQRHFGHRTFLVIGRVVHLTPVSGTAVWHINDVTDGSYSISNASVNGGEYTWYRWKPDITLLPLPKMFIC